MEKLIALYQKRRVFTEYNSSVPAELANQIREAENKIAGKVLDTVAGYLPEEIEMPGGFRIVVGFEYCNGKLVKKAAVLNARLEEKFDNATEVPSIDSVEEDVEIEDDDEADDESNEPSGTFERKRSKSIGFTVKFGDGKIIKYPTAQRTMIEALRYMGLERSSRFHDELFKGYTLIGKIKRSTEGKRWQIMVDGWWIYINMHNERKISCLKGVAKMLNIPMEIVQDEEKPAAPSVPARPRILPRRRGRILYSLNGAGSFAKNRSVWETVKRYQEEFPDASFDDILEYFPASLQGSYGVIRTLQDIEERSERNQTEEGRWFLEPDYILTSSDGVPFAVCREWGDNYANFQNHVEKELGWKLEESDQQDR